MTRLFGFPEPYYFLKKLALLASSFLHLHIHFRRCCGKGIGAPTTSFAREQCSTTISEVDHRRRQNVVAQQQQQQQQFVVVVVVS